MVQTFTLGKVTNAALASPRDGTMRAILAPQPGELDELRFVTAPVPEVGRGEVLIRVAAAGVNRADIMQRKGRYDPPAGVTQILGLECSGTIVVTGAGAPPAMLGQQVCALLAGGAYAEYVSAPAEHVLPLPPGVDIVEAAGVIEAAATVWSNLFDGDGVEAGSRVLIHGGSSGIGSMAIQLAHAAGALVATTVGSATKAEYCRSLGADVVINYREQDFDEALRELDLSFDHILDMVGADYLDRNLGCLARGGRLAIIGLQGGRRASLDMEQLLARNLTVTGRGLRMRPHDEKAAIVAQVRDHVWPLFASGAVKTTTFRRFGLHQAMAAHHLMETSGHLGKLLLTIDESSTKGTP